MYEVQTYTLFCGWVNCWTEDEQPKFFDTEREAEEAIGEHLASMHPYMRQQYTDADFRVVKV